MVVSDQYLKTVAKQQAQNLKGVDLTGIYFEGSLATVRLIWLPQDMSFYLHTLNAALLNNT